MPFRRLNTGIGGLQQDIVYLQQCVVNIRKGNNGIGGYCLRTCCNVLLSHLAYRRKSERQQSIISTFFSTMNKYTIHPIVVGTKVFDKGMMTYQHDYGTPYTIPIYSWYIEGGEKKS